MTASKLHWIVVSPSLAAPAWCAKFHEQAESANISVWDDHALHASTLEHGIVLTDDLTLAVSLGVQRDHLTVVALQPFIDLEGCATDAEVNARVEVVSRRIAAAYAVSDRIVDAPGHSVRVEGLAAFEAAEVRRLPHRVVTQREAALQKALCIFTQNECAWSQALFTYDQRNGLSGPQTGRLDVTGRPRFLVTGPYINMPAGTWQAKITLSFDHDVSNRRFRIDWGGIEAYASYEFCPGRSGKFDITLEHFWTEPGPAELRILVLEGVFHGDVIFGGAVVSRVEQPDDVHGTVLG